MSTTEKAAPAPAAPARLAEGVLSNVDIAASTMANIAPAMSFFFGFGLIAETAGVASPLTIIAAAVAIALLGNTLTQFTRAHPSTGSFVTYIGRAFGPYSAVVTAIVLGAGYILAVSSVVCISGGWTHDLLKTYLHISIPWQLLTAILTLTAGFMVIRGVGGSTKIAALMFAFELGLLIIVGIVLLIQHSGSINLEPFNPSNLSGGFSGLSLGFPLAVYMFIGWENSAALAEESRDPRVGIGKAIFSAVLLLGVTYIFLSYATVIAYDQNVQKLTSASVPFVDAAKGVLGFIGFLAFIAGFTSIFGTLISAANAQARIIFNSGREGLLPRWVGQVTEKGKTPWAAFVVFFGLALGLVYIFGWSTDPFVFFGEIGTLGTILVALTYLVANLALPFYWRKHHADTLNPLRHVILPLLGVVAIGFPLYELVKPGQPAPFSRYPLIALGVVVVGAVW
ncbi:MAG TPA: APC family permease, partial [Solirubrobacteraceae bacterium]